MSIREPMDDIEIVQWVNNAREAQQWRDRQHNGERIEVEGQGYRVIEVFELEKPLGAPRNGHVWIVKGQRCA